MTDLFAILACSILAALTIFQFALIFGAPIGKYAWGGAHTVLPKNLRIGSVISILIYGIIAAIILSKAGVVAVLDNPQVVSTASWVIAAYFCLGVVLNAMSRSKAERNLMTPVAAVLAMLTCLIAAS